MAPTTGRTGPPPAASPENATDAHTDVHTDAHADADIYTATLSDLTRRVIALHSSVHAIRAAAHAAPATVTDGHRWRHLADLHHDVRAIAAGLNEALGHIGGLDGGLHTGLGRDLTGDLGRLRPPRRPGPAGDVVSLRRRRP